MIIFLGDYNQYHGYWFLGNARSKGIIGHDFDLFLQKCSSRNPWRADFLSSWLSMRVQVRFCMRVAIPLFTYL